MKKGLFFKGSGDSVEYDGKGLDAGLLADGDGLLEKVFGLRQAGFVVDMEDGDGFACLDGIADFL